MTTVYGVNNNTLRGPLAMKDFHSSGTPPYHYFFIIIIFVIPFSIITIIIAVIISISVSIIKRVTIQIRKVSPTAACWARHDIAFNLHRI